MLNFPSQKAFVFVGFLLPQQVFGGHASTEPVTDWVHQAQQEKKGCNKKSFYRNNTTSEKFWLLDAQTP